MAKRKVTDCHDDSPGDAQRCRSNNFHFGYYGRGESIADNESMLRNMTARTLALLQLPTGAAVRFGDMGSGRGAPAKQALEMFPAATVVGVDRSPLQIQQSEQLMPQELRPRVHFVCADFQCTGLESGSFDGVYAIESACYAEGAGKERLLAEMYRLLKPGGRFAIADGGLRGAVPRYGLFASLYARLCSKRALNGMASIAALTGAAHRVGFQRVTVRDVSWNVMPSLGHIPLAAWRNLREHEGQWSQAQRDNLEVPLLQIMIAAFPQYVGYFLASGQKPPATPSRQLPRKRRYLG